ncbi:MAG: hypothetical protein NC311_10290 [Muribaculaceae bacterium]|nr:hypothetical protein [Muribaculaceae bacterium]
MDTSKFYVNLDYTERNLLLDSLNELRNELISKSKFTDAVDDLIEKVVKAKRRRFIVNM